MHSACAHGRTRRTLCVFTRRTSYASDPTHSVRSHTHLCVSDTLSPVGLCCAQSHLRSGSSARFSTLQIGPKIEIGLLFGSIGGQQGRLFPGRTDLSPSSPARLRPARPPRRVPPRPDRPEVCPGFGFDWCEMRTSSHLRFSATRKRSCRFQNLDIPRAARDGAAHGGGTGRARASQDRTRVGRSAHETTVLLALEGIEDNCCEGFFGSTSKQISMETDGAKPAVDNRFIRGTTDTVRSWLLTSVLTPFCLCEFFSCKRMREKLTPSFTIPVEKTKNPFSFHFGWKNEELLFFFQILFPI